MLALEAAGTPVAVVACRRAVQQEAARAEQEAARAEQEAAQLRQEAARVLRAA